LERLQTLKNVDDFIKSYKNSWPDVVLLDLEMPKMNGAETANILCKIAPAEDYCPYDA